MQEAFHLVEEMTKIFICIVLIDHQETYLNIPEAIRSIRLMDKSNIFFSIELWKALCISLNVRCQDMVSHKWHTPLPQRTRMKCKIANVILGIQNRQYSCFNLHNAMIQTWLAIGTHGWTYLCMKHRCKFPHMCKLSMVRLSFVAMITNSSRTARISHASFTWSQSVWDNVNDDHVICFETWPLDRTVVIGPYRWLALATNKAIAWRSL